MTPRHLTDDHPGKAAVTTPTTEEELQRPPAEVRYAEELAALRAEDRDPRPPGWELSLRAASRFIVGDQTAGIARKFVGDPVSPAHHAPDAELAAHSSCPARAWSSAGRYQPSVSGVM
ncbi:hypothetical protein ACFVUY_08245 [Kitasatospora sp. NPDC058063]|uniref:hypothetical protein n=1 Tax=unclassified Kitasatospora TaxID=2633591 RepID=UPI0036D96A52